ncbi:MAG: hypothetical protein ACYC3A_09550 [Halothiobacillus sp.]
MTDKLIKINELTRSLQTNYPAETNAFLNFMQQAEGTAALDMRIKALIMLSFYVGNVI